jgi:hypothetical protein
MIPGWLAKVGVFSFSLILAATAFQTFLQYTLAPALQRGDFALAYVLLRRINGQNVTSEVSLMGFVLLLIAAVVVGVRSGSCVATEKQRKTWDDLILTPLSIEQIVGQKRWGIVQAAIPYLVVYSLPMFGLCIFDGGASIPVAVAWTLAAVAALVVVSRLAMMIPAETDEHRQPFGVSKAA